MADADAAFTDSIPEMYERILVPMQFAPYAADIVERARAIGARTILETAAGTGIVTRLLAEALPNAKIEATDLNEAMLACAVRRSASSAVRWSTADATALPFGDTIFDLVICQFGMMFFGDRLRAFREARRVLRTSGAYLFNVWDGLEHNEVARIVSDAVAEAFPDNPPLWLKRTPYGHGDPAAIERDLRAAGFERVACEPVVKRCVTTAANAAFGICEGSPLRAEILARDARRLPEVVERATRALHAAFDGNAVDGEMRAFVFTAN